MKPHLIYATSPHCYSLRIECPGLDEGGCRLVYENPDGCRCTDPDCVCRPGPNGEEPDHHGCGEFDHAAIDGMPGCMTHLGDECGVLDWYKHLGSEMIDDGDWPGDSPWQARIEWDGNGEYMTLVPWKVEP